jgi:uncharacterized membrane protein
MLAEFIEKLYNNRKKYLYCFMAFVISLLLVSLGMLKGLIVILVSILGYKLGDEELTKKVKKKIRDMVDK